MLLKLKLDHKIPLSIAAVFVKIFRSLEHFQILSLIRLILFVQKVRSRDFIEASKLTKQSEVKILDQKPGFLLYF
jgi:hypothetical protein